MQENLAQVANDNANQSRVPWKTRLGWGAGGLADNYIINAITPHILIMPIYNLVFGLDPVKIGIALSVPRFIDAITDPLMGVLSDNTHSRWGRRRPYIVVGAIVSAILLPFLWLPPLRTEMFLFVYLITVSTVLSLSYTVYAVPYTALGYELTNDYDEKTRVLAWRMYIGLIGSLTLPWAYRAAQSKWFGGDVVLGAVVISCLAGVVVILTGVLPAITAREKDFAVVQEKPGFIRAITTSFTNKSFTILLIAYLVIIGGVFSAGNLPLYINIFYVCGGDRVMAAAILGISGSMMALMSYVSLPLITWISIRTSKRFAMISGLLFAAAGIGSTWWTMTPKWPYLQLVSTFIAGLGLQGCWLMVSSMTADVCDEEELQTGLRREGVYGAVLTFVMKAAIAASAILAGAVLALSGYNTELANTVGQIDPVVITKMRWLLIAVNTAPLLTAAGMFLFYPITRARAEQTQRILASRRQPLQNSFNDF